MYTNAVVADLEALVALAHAHDIPLVVDNTVATPYLLNPIKYGADIVYVQRQRRSAGMVMSLWKPASSIGQMASFRIF